MSPDTTMTAKTKRPQKIVDALLQARARVDGLPVAMEQKTGLVDHRALLGEVVAVAGASGMAGARDHGRRPVTTRTPPGSCPKAALQKEEHRAHVSPNPIVITGTSRTACRGEVSREPPMDLEHEPCRGLSSRTAPFGSAL